MKLTPEWITGFVDGDGSFVVQKQKEKYLRHRFIVSQDQRSRDVLYALKKEFQCGNVHRAGGTMYHFEIGNQEHLRDRVIPHFCKYPLQTKKRADFVKFADSLFHYLKLIGKETGNPVSPPEKGYQLSNGWFRGFVDAEGSFVCSLPRGRVIPQFLLGLSHQESELLQECKNWLACGSCRSIPEKAFFFHIASCEELENQLFPLLETRGSAVLLRTIKRISFQKFRKIVRLIREKKHLDSSGLNKIKKLQSQLNKHNDSLFPRPVFFSHPVSSEL